jgi:WhiB family transcriptional regulator, redox-sensing transcriptional regulator
MRSIGTAVRLEQGRAWREVQPVAIAEWLRYARGEPGESTDRELAGRVYRQARCASSRLDPDEWFPLALDVAKARDQAASAISICAGCAVRAYCLELSLRHPFDIGAYGVWGGLVEGERRALRRQWLAGTRVTEFL